MRVAVLPMLAAFLSASLAAAADRPAAERSPSAGRPRVFVLTDISNEPDDEESLVRFLVYANEFDVEGIVATTSTWLRGTTREDLIRRQVEAYRLVRPNLVKHAAGFPEAEHLLSVTRTGQGSYGMAAVGEGKETPGSRLLLEAAGRDDGRPLWVSVWGGANTLAQALRDAREALAPADLDRLAAKLRVYAISDQDDAGPWLRREFPGLFYVVSPSDQGSGDYRRATWTGISGDRHYKNGPGHEFALVSNPWLEENVIRDHGPLGALYPRVAYIMEGDTPAFLGLVGNGLGWAESPAYGGWGGRYALRRPPGETRPIWTDGHDEDSDDARDTVTASTGETVTSDQATVWRWRKHFQHDFAARMDWCAADEFGKANHNPVAVLNGDDSKHVLEIAAEPGETVTLSADGSSDPDGNPSKTTWWVYREAGSLRGEVSLSAAEGANTSLVAPDVTRPETVHVILQLEDDGNPSLFAYRRAVVTVTPHGE